MTPRDAGEANAEDFIRLANRRTNKALNQIRLIGNLSNKAAYSYNRKQVRKIFKALRAQLRESESRFYGKKIMNTDFHLTP